MDNNTMPEWVDFNKNKIGFHNLTPFSYIILLGGTVEPDAGCAPWGGVQKERYVFVGDRLGELTIRYEDSTEDQIPLVLGYNVWFSGRWLETPEPFSEQYPDNRKLLRDTIYLSGAMEGRTPYQLCIKLSGKPVKEVFWTNTHPFSCVQFRSLKFTDEVEEEFLKTHTISTQDPYPTAVKENILKIIRLLSTLEEDFCSFDNVIPRCKDGTDILFSGSPLAEILSGIYAENKKKLAEKIDGEGIFHTSTEKAPTYLYDGFGGYRKDCGNYYPLVYSRDAGRGIMCLTDLFETEKASLAIGKLHRWMMRFPQKFPELQMGGKPIPGHWVVTPNEPDLYQKYCVASGWPTRYTKEKFGDHFGDIGNMETDGHGLMMMAVYKFYLKTGRNQGWVIGNYEYIKEAAEFVVWALDNPELSFAKDDLLYAESEGGMCDYTLYCNIPCYLGLEGYAEMAEEAGKENDAGKWKQYARRLYDAIEKQLSKDNEWDIADQQWFNPKTSDKPVDAEDKKSWNSASLGFYHDPVVTFFSDFAGLDVHNKMPAKWLTYSRNTYAGDSSPAAFKNVGKLDRKYCYYAPTGLGYDQCMVTQNALLFDMVSDYTGYVEALTKLCFSPRQPDPFIVPECAVVDLDKGIIRRQGDLGNLVQQAEVIKVLLIMAGIDANNPEEILIIPRIPRGWSVNVKDYRWISGKDEKCSLAYNINIEGEHLVKFSLSLNGCQAPVRVRFGPFPAEKKNITITDQNKKQEISCFLSGDSSWAWYSLGDLTKSTWDISVQ